MITLAAETDSDADTIGGLAFVFGLAALCALIIVVVLWQAASIYRARTAASKEDGYRKLAERAIAAHEECLAGQQRTEALLSDMRARMTGLEKVLKEVE